MVGGEELRSICEWHTAAHVSAAAPDQRYMMFWGTIVLVWEKVFVGVLSIRIMDWFFETAVCLKREVAKDVHVKENAGRTKVKIESVDRNIAAEKLFVIDEKVNVEQKDRPVWISF